MESSEAKNMLGTLRVELVATERRCDALRKIIDGIVELFPDIDEPTGAQAPGGTVKTPEAVRRILMETPRKWFTVKAMMRELEERDLVPESDNPLAVVRTALTRIVTEPGFRKDTGSTGAITYSYRPLNAESPTEAGLSNSSSSPRGGGQVESLT
jgi:hypothetical protein